MSKKLKIRLIIVAVFVVIVVLAVGKKKGFIGKENSLKVSTELVEKRTIIETVAANGKIQPEVEVKITPYISGEVISLYVMEGDEVKKGDLLAKIDPEIYISNYERMEANLNTQMANEANTKARLVQVKAQYKNAKRSYERNKSLWEQQVISQADWDASVSAYEVAEAEVSAAEQSLVAAKYQVSSAKASVKEAKENLNKTSIIAPHAGTVSRLNVEQGERVAGASQFSAGTEIMSIANLNLMEVDVEVNENDIVRVTIGDTAIIEVDAYLNDKFNGVISEIATSANITGVSADQVTNFNVKVRILKESYAHLIPENNTLYFPFRPGMSATVDIQTETVSDILTIPIQAVTTRADTTGKVSVRAIKAADEDKPEGENSEDEDKEFKEYVFLYEDGIARMQEVKTGIQDNTYIYIIEGLEDGQEVIVAPYRAVTKKLKNNDEVKKVDKEELFTED
ncbi:MAG: efflux RND transporter periplasmic adaptor subunit [Bacteroidales bacterium]|nr:efflux RND transporter periplasmic adaptor subunit [Bacteroidales bacterium]